MAKQSNKKSNKASNQVSATKSQINALLESIEDIKSKIRGVWADKTLSDDEQITKIEELHDILWATQHYVNRLIDAETSSESSSGGERDVNQESGAFFQWTDPATTEDAFKQVQLLVPMIDELKAKIAAVELDSSISLKAKAKRLSGMKDCLESVQLRVVELSERYLQDCAA